MRLKPHVLTKLGLKQKSIWQNTLQNTPYKFRTSQNLNPECKCTFNFSTITKPRKSFQQYHLTCQHKAISYRLMLTRLFRKKTESILSNKNINIGFCGWIWTNRKVIGFYGQHTYRLRICKKQNKRINRQKETHKLPSKFYTE